MAHLTVARVVSGAALAITVGLVSAPTAQAAPAAERPSVGALAGPLSLDNLLSLRFLTPTVRDAKRQITGLASGLSPAPANAVGLGHLLK
ncbi:hypothetical protein MTF65_14795 [Streptomyces sp. APSN-46.1]|uniref:hypothetical protein n=1 Tax=Streptomyces sp. APSN-46.1 TaxID=2929049 RepID=UPI001FB2F06F|nr:hypothetical protein [Streptomyces sp. APSN-46.1]MCJ1678594.1 hypothetical protein [Streptomyces sp. APSN-46.1]